PQPAELEAPEEEQVEAPQEEGWDEVTLREILAELHRAVGAYLGGLRYLYNRALRKNPDLEGKFTVRMTVGPDGKIQEVEVVESTLGDPDLERALLARIRKWTLPAVADRPVTVTYPFVFFPSM
ncbi:MAG: TonB family protein, partial [Candidatus Dadabacteria bacterium]